MRRNKMTPEQADAERRYHEGFQEGYHDGYTDGLRDQEGFIQARLMLALRAHLGYSAKQISQFIDVLNAQPVETLWDAARVKDEFNQEFRELQGKA